MTAKPPFGPDKPVAVVPTGPESDAETEFEATGDAETAAPIEPREFDEAHQALVSDDSIQFDLPMFEPPPETPPPEWLQWLVGFLSTDHPVLRGLLWALLGAAVLLILWLVIRRLSGADWPWRRRAATDADEETWRPAEAPARALLGEADALANRGLFAEAVHLLLFRSIADLDERKPGLVRPALTSRDIAGLGDIPSGPRGAFARIAMLVEQSLFARRPLAEGDWTSCRAAYEEFAFAESWRG